MDQSTVALAADIYARSFASFDEATSTVLTELQAQLPGSGIVLGRFDRVSDVYRVIASAGATPFGLTPVSELPIEDAFCSSLAGYDAIVRCEDAPVEEAATHGRGIRSYIGIALELSDGEHVGALCAVSAEPGRYTDADVRLLTVLGRLLAYELERQLQREALERMTAELARNARADDLTGLLNRAAFLADLEREWKLTSRDWTDSHLLVVEVDGLRQVTGEFGHRSAEDAIVDFTDALRAATRSTDILARVGAEEFGAVLVRTTGGCDMASLQDRLTTEVERVLQNRPYRFGISTGHVSLLESMSAGEALTTARTRLAAGRRERAATRLLDLH